MNATFQKNIQLIAQILVRIVLNSRTLANSPFIFTCLAIKYQLSFTELDRRPNDYTSVIQVKSLNSKRRPYFIDRFGPLRPSATINPTHTARRIELIVPRMAKTIRIRRIAINDEPSLVIFIKAHFPYASLIAMKFDIPCAVATIRVAFLPVVSPVVGRENTRKTPTLGIGSFLTNRQP